MLIGGLQKTSFIDFPKKIAAIVFTIGCNFRCPYCHNPELVTQVYKTIDEKYIFDFLKTRKGKLDGVVITGGEPCLQSGLIDFLKKIKDQGFLVKLDTNGSYPEVLEKVISLQLADYIAMDIKAPLLKYEDTVKTDFDAAKIGKSVILIKNSGIDYEFRTTVTKELLTPQDFIEIGKLLSNAKRYYFQKFLYTKTIDENFKKAETFDDVDFDLAAKFLKEYNVQEINIR